MVAPFCGLAIPIDRIINVLYKLVRGVPQIIILKDISFGEVGNNLHPTGLFVFLYLFLFVHIQNPPVRTTVFMERLQFSRQSFLIFMDKFSTAYPHGLVAKW